MNVRYRGEAQADERPAAQSTHERRRFKGAPRRLPTVMRFGAAYATAVALYLFGAPNVLNTPYYTGSDAGLYNAVFYQMTLGRTLYRDVFEMKDPLFFHGYALFRELLGLSGPMFWETVVTVLTLAVLFRIAWRVGLSASQSLLAVLAYLAFYFNPNVYQPLHTYHQALLFLLSAVAFALEDRPLPAGVAFALALWSKATLATFFPAALAAVLVPISRRHAGALPRLVRFALGGVTASSLVVLFLAVSDELTGYREGLRANLGYTKVISETLGWHNDPVGRAREVLGTPMLWVLGSAAAIVAAAGAFTSLAELRRRREPVDAIPGSATIPLGIVAVALGCLAGFALILREAAWFNHYFAALAPGVFFSALALATTVRLVPPNALKAAIAWVAAGSLATGALATGFFPTTGLTYRPPACPISHAGDEPNPEFVDCLRTIDFATGPGRTFAVVGPNSNDTPTASMPPDLVLGCRLISLFPWQGDRLLDEFIDCLDRHVDVVIAEDLVHFNRPVDQARAQRIHSITRGKFDLVGQCGRFTIWERKELRSAAH